MVRPSPELTPDEIQNFRERGYHFPITVLAPHEVARFRDKFLSYREANLDRLRRVPGNRTYEVYSEMHFVSGWVYQLVTHRRILDAAQSLLGPNLIAWNTNWFAKMPGEKTFVSWHQDGMYWRLTPSEVVTAWIALTPSRSTNGCLRVVPGTHLCPAMPHQETYDPDNALSRGQDIAAQVDESQAVDIELEPGEMSLHDVWIAHGSRANTSSDTPRIGLAIRYVSTQVKQQSPQRPLGMLVRGRDEYGYFQLQPPPTREDLLPNDPEHRAIVDRIRASIMPAKAQAAP